MKQCWPRMKRCAAVFVMGALCAGAIEAQTKSLPTPPSSRIPSETEAEFYAAADEVLGVMSKMLGLPVKAPLKKSIRTKEQIRAYLVAEQKRDEPESKQYADQRTLEAFGLIPKGFPLESFMLNLLTNQVAGLYDPKKKEFFIAAWISPVEQKPVMAHELTHALDDQYFHLEKWQKAAQANDDASLARDAVVEGSAVASMLDYSLAGLHVTVRQLPDIAPLIKTNVAGQMDKDPVLSKAPPFVRDELLFPYLSGAVFTQQFLKANSGWPDFKKVFGNPPVSTQQILHPNLYFQRVTPRTVELPHLSSAVPHDWKKLEENVVGEFALREILKQFEGEDQGSKYAAMWAGDRYAVFENQATKQTLLIVLYALDRVSDEQGFYDAYRDALKKKYGLKQFPRESQEFAEGNEALLRCNGAECISVECPDSDVMQHVGNEMMKNFGWPPLRLLGANTNRSSGLSLSASREKN